MDEVPLYIEPIIGWRTLEYQGYGDERIVSPYRSSFHWWPERTSQEADCRTVTHGKLDSWHDDGEIPSDSCQCGYYAWYRLEKAQSGAIAFRSCRPANFEFVALVAAWGNTILHLEGLRSQYMSVLAFHNGAYPCRDRLQKIADSMEIPFLNRSDLLALASESGINLTPETLP